MIWAIVLGLFALGMALAGIWLFYLGQKTVPTKLAIVNVVVLYLLLSIMCLVFVSGKRL
jgi:hypothetical protein